MDGESRTYRRGLWLQFGPPSVIETTVCLGQHRLKESSCKCSGTAVLVAGVATVLPLEEARVAHEMLGGVPHKQDKIVLSMSVIVEIKPIGNTAGDQT